MNYVSYRKLASDVRSFAATLPDVGMVIGIPRSGMLVASMIAAERNWVLAALGPHGAYSMSHGGRYREREVSGAIVVDDTFHEGTSIAQARQIVSDERGVIGVHYAAMYVSQLGTETLDFWHEVVEAPRLFAWNWQHHKIIETSLVDFDGLLCDDPTIAEVVDESGYERFLQTTKPLWRPSAKVGSIVTARLEKWREASERWLAEHRVLHGGLRMLGGGITAQERLDLDWHWRHKADVYRATPWAELFIESCDDQSRKIAASTGRPVLCPSTDTCY